MEEEFETRVSEITRRKNITGVICSDAQGICLNVRGVCSKRQAGIATGIIDKAKELISDTRNSKIDPIISVEFQTKAIHFKGMKTIAMVVHENNTKEIM